MEGPRARLRGHAGGSAPGHPALLPHQPLGASATSEGPLSPVAVAETCQGDFWGAGPSARPPGLLAGTSPSACVWPQETSSVSTPVLVGEAGHTHSPLFQEGAGPEPSPGWGGSSPGPRRGAPLPLTPPEKPGVGAMWATLTGPLTAGSAFQNQHLEALSPGRPALPTGPSLRGPRSSVPGPVCRGCSLNTPHSFALLQVASGHGSH